MPSPSAGGGGGGRGDAAAATAARRCAAARRGLGGGMDRREDAVRFPASVVEAGGGGVRDGEEAAILTFQKQHGEATGEVRGGE